MGICPIYLKFILPILAVSQSPIGQKVAAIALISAIYGLAAIAFLF
ncbi:MAG: hypothetical protein ACRC6M_16790 [Microcystaceae cyanobacterium]